jgi:TetR/AcrR family transcriptional regulator, transcriptional repressor of aconitase
MPRVSQEHLAARRRQILDAARRCFVRNGFHATSMQDVLAEANLSAGAVYRYFRSKEDIVEAIAAEAVAELTAAFEAVFDPNAPPPLEEVLGAILATLERLTATQDLARMIVQVEGEAIRSPAVAERMTKAAHGIRAFLTRLVEAYQDRGLMRRDVPAEHVGRVLTSFVPGFLAQRALLGDVDAAMFQNGLHALLTAHRAESPQDVSH